MRRAYRREPVPSKRLRVRALRRGGVAVIVAAATIAAPLIAGGPAAALGSGSWKPTGPMATPRAGATATLLAGPACQTTTPASWCGRVLVAGGRDVGPNGAQSGSGAELFDPRTGTWTATRPMIVARSDHAATLLNDGRVLVTGGTDASGNSSSTAEIYDPATGAWSRTPLMVQARALHTATLLASGQVLVAGGEAAFSPSGGGCTDSATQKSSELWSPSTNSFSGTTGCMVVPRFQHTASLLSDGRVLVAGGTANGQGVGLNATEIYDPGKGGWVQGPSLAVARFAHVAAPLPGGKVLVAGGESSGTILNGAESYDPGTGRWSPAGAMVSKRSRAAATVLSDGAVLVAGGETDSTGQLAGAAPRVPRAGSELFDPVGRFWTATAPMQSARADMTLTALAGGLTALVAGGDQITGTSPILRQAELFTYTLPTTPPGGGPTPGTPGTPKLPTVNPTPVPGCKPAPKMTLDPPLVPAGYTTLVRGSGFCPGPVVLAWDRGLGGATAIADAAGNFTTRMLVLPREEPSARNLVAAGTGGATTSQPFLVVPGGAGPPSFIERR